MHFEFKTRANRLDTQHYQDLPPYMIDSLLNNAVNYFMEHYAYVNRIPFELTQSRIDMLSNLVIGYPEQSALIPTQVDNNVYEVKLENLVYKYAHLVRAFAEGNCGLVNVKLVPMEILTRTLNDELQKPSVKWKRLVATLRKTSDSINPSLYIYGENGMTVDSVKIEYLKQPKPVFIGLYNSIDYENCVSLGGNCDEFYNVGTLPVDCEINPQYHSLIVDIAVREFSRYTDNINKIQTLDNKILLTT
jgi:hypothetical protein